MGISINQEQFDHISSGFHPSPDQSSSLNCDAYTRKEWYELDQNRIISSSWQWICHREKLVQPGSYVTAKVANSPIFITRDQNNKLAAFYNVCKHRAMQLLDGEGTNSKIMCPYHGWTYNLQGQLVSAPATEHLKNFNPSKICLSDIQVEEFCGFIFVNLDPAAPPLKGISSNLADEIEFWAPGIPELTFAKRLTYEINSNWKNVVDNFLECYHCPIAHKDFCSLVDMNTYKVTTQGIYSSHMAEAGRSNNSAYNVNNATVQDHAVWWLWPNTCLMRYPGRGNMIVMQIIPNGPNKTLETYDFFLESSEPNADEVESINYLNDVLQAEDIWLVENVQRGMESPAFTQGRIVHDPNGSGKSEHAVHHFHGLILDAYKKSIVP